MLPCIYDLPVTVAGITLNLWIFAGFYLDAMDFPSALALAPQLLNSENRMSSIKFFEVYRNEMGYNVAQGHL